MQNQCTSDVLSRAFRTDLARRPQERVTVSRKPSYNEQLVISNVVCTAQLENVPNMNQLADVFYGQYNKRKFAAACRIRLDNPRCTVLIFNVGKMVVTAVRSLAEGIECFHAIVALLVQRGFLDVYFSSASVVNYASTYYLSHKLDMDKVLKLYPDVMLWKSSFAGGKLKVPIPGGASVLLYESGKLVITGARNLVDLERSKNWVREHMAAAATTALNPAHANNSDDCNTENTVLWDKIDDIMQTCNKRSGAVPAIELLLNELSLTPHQ